jgi:hypothetical protein
MKRQALFPAYNPRVLCLGVGQKAGLFRLLDLRGVDHYVSVRNVAAAQAILDNIDRPIRAAHKQVA